ncbi:MAG: hypothetical protein AAF988_05620 [Pseudomonadota bacterium]
MGSLTKRPKLPNQPQQIIRTVEVPVTTTPTPSAEETEAASKVEQQEARQESLLRRSRGRLGTIFTGFRGLLETRGDTQRKSLLGE